MNKSQVADKTTQISKVIKRSQNKKIISLVSKHATFLFTKTAIKQMSISRGWGEEENDNVHK